MKLTCRKLISIAPTAGKAGKPLGFTVSGVIPKGLEVRQFISITILASYLFVSVSPVLASDSLYFIHTDHLGSTVAITDENGEVVSQNRYFPYGEDRIPTDGKRIFTERNYTSQIKDAKTSLYYYNARYYDPALGTFVSPDPAGDGSNRFGYVSGNPLRFTDPSGHAADIGGAGGGAGRNNPNLPLFLPTILRPYQDITLSTELPFSHRGWSSSQWQPGEIRMLRSIISELPTSLTHGAKFVRIQNSDSSIFFSKAFFDENANVIIFDDTSLSTSFLIHGPFGKRGVKWRVIHELMHRLEYASGDVGLLYDERIDSHDSPLTSALVGFAAAAGDKITFSPEKSPAQDGNTPAVKVSFDEDWWRWHLPRSYGLTNFRELFAEVGTQFLFADEAEFEDFYGSDMYNFWEELIYSGEAQ